MTTPNVQSNENQVASHKKEQGAFSFLKQLLTPVKAENTNETDLSNATDHGNLEILERNIARTNKPRF